MSFDTGLFIRKTGSGLIGTGEVNLSSGHCSEIRVLPDAEAALRDVEERRRGKDMPYEDLSVSGFAEPDHQHYTLLDEQIWAIAGEPP